MTNDIVSELMLLRCDWKEMDGGESDEENGDTSTVRVNPRACIDID
jgi:hypothetical protein